MPIVAATKKPAKERLPSNERLVLAIGLLLTLSFAMGLGLMLDALKHYGEAQDPDAQSLVIAADYPRQLIDFALTDQSGHAITRADLKGKIVVVSFVFTGCSAVCPYVNAQMEKVQQLTARQPDVELLSLTLDPDDDTAPVLAKYGESFGEDIHRWLFLTGDESMMRKLIGTSFLRPDTAGEFASMPGNFAHSQSIVLVDATGHIIRYYDGLNQGAAEAVVGDIQKLKNGA